MVARGSARPGSGGLLRSADRDQDGGAGGEVVSGSRAGGAGGGRGRVGGNPSGRPRAVVSGLVGGLGGVRRLGGGAGVAVVGIAFAGRGTAGGTCRPGGPVGPGDRAAPGSAAGGLRRKSEGRRCAAGGVRRSCCLPDLFGAVGAGGMGARAVARIDAREAPGSRVEPPAIPAARGVLDEPGAVAGRRPDPARARGGHRRGGRRGAARRGAGLRGNAALGVARLAAGRTPRVLGLVGILDPGSGLADRNPAVGDPAGAGDRPGGLARLGRRSGVGVVGRSAGAKARRGGGSGGRRAPAPAALEPSRVDTYAVARDTAGPASASSSSSSPPPARGVSLDLTGEEHMATPGGAAGSGAGLGLGPGLGSTVSEVIYSFRVPADVPREPEAYRPVGRGVPHGPGRRRGCGAPGWNRGGHSRGRPADPASGGGGGRGGGAVGRIFARSSHGRRARCAARGAGPPRDGGRGVDDPDVSVGHRPGVEPG